MSAALSVSPIELQLHLFKRSVKGKREFFFLLHSKFAIPAACQPLWGSWSCRLTLCAACRSDAWWIPSVPGVEREGNWSAALFRPQLTGMVSKTQWQLKSPRCHTVSDVNEEVRVKGTYAELFASFFFNCVQYIPYYVALIDFFPLYLSFAFCLQEASLFKPTLGWYLCTMFNLIYFFFPTCIVCSCRWCHSTIHVNLDSSCQCSQYFWNYFSLISSVVRQLGAGYWLLTCRRNGLFAKNIEILRPSESFFCWRLSKRMS